jgi:hypothetical protein
LKKQPSPNQDGGDRKMQEVLGLSANIISSIFFALFLTTAFYFLQAGQHTLALWFGFASWVAAGLAVTFYLQANLLKEDLFHGFLVPANDPSPPPPANRPPPPKDAVSLYLGNSLAYVTESSTVVLRLTRGQ